MAVLGTGIDVAYPERNAGCSTRSWPRAARWSRSSRPGAQPRKGSFPVRNTVIAGLADVVVVVEAGLASGTLHTVRAHASRCGRPVVALPGSHGTDALILDGALPVTGAADVLAVLDGKPPAPPALPEDPIAAQALRRARRTSRATSAIWRFAPGLRSAPARRWWSIWSLGAWLRARQVGVIVRLR